MKLGEKMVVGFYLLIIAFTVLAGFYLYANDFSTETLGIIFPAVGAILLSFYLGIKTVWIDAPEPQNNKVTIAILHDFQSGQISSMFSHKLLDSPEAFKKFRGIQQLDLYRQYNDFKKMDIWENLKTKSEEKTEGNEPVLTRLLEYAIIDWFSKVDNIVGYEENSIYLINGGGGGSSIPRNLVGVSSSKGEDEWNPFLRAKNIALNLPKGSIIERKKLDYAGIDFRIETPHSNINIRISGGAGGIFETSVDKVGHRIRKLLGLSQKTPSLWVHGFQAEIETSQNAFSRFSNQAKLENVWLERIRSKFEDDFSWDLLRERYASIEI